MTDVNLTVSTVISGVDQPTSMVFMGPEISSFGKGQRQVKHIVNGRWWASLLTWPSTQHPSAACWESLCSRTSTLPRCLSLLDQSSTGADSTNH